MIKLLYWLLLQIESMQLHKRLRVFAFQLVGDYVITKKTFPTVKLFSLILVQLTFSKG